MRLLLLGNLDNRRIKLQVLAAKEIGLPPPTLISWASLLSRWTFTEVAEKAASCDLLRIDSPGECWQIDKLLIERGATIQDLKVHLKEEKGRIQYLESYGIGLLTSIQEAQQTAEKTGIRSVYSATALQRMVDKVKCQKTLATAGLPVPARLCDRLKSFDHLMTLLKENQCRQVFLKPRYGSSASGIMAFRMHKASGNLIMRTSIEATGGSLYNSLKIREYQDRRTISKIVNKMISAPLYVEHWVPKFSLAGKSWDLRIVVIHGQATHCVLRTSKSPMTNLHLGNQRGMLSQFEDYLGAERLNAAKVLAEQAVYTVGAPATAGVDILISTSGQPLVAEVNAFGDLLPGITYNGRSTYEHLFRGYSEKIPSNPI